MKVGLKWALSDAHVPTGQDNSQRQLSVSLSASGEGSQAPINLCFVLDCSGSMGGIPLKTVKQAASRLIDRMTARDRISIITFNHKAKILVENQPATDLENIKRKIDGLKASGGTCIDDGLKAGIEQLASGKEGRISQLLLLTDGENEHGDNARAVKLANVAVGYNLTISTLGFGDHWNQDVLEQIADAGGGSLNYIQHAEEAVGIFGRLFTRIQSVGLTNAFLNIELADGTRLADLKPVAQVAPETVELPVVQQGNEAIVRIGDLMKDQPRVVLLNLYVPRLTASTAVIAQLQVTYDDPVIEATAQSTEKFAVNIEAQDAYVPAVDAGVQQNILALAKYRQTQIAEEKLKAGDRKGAVTMLQSAANTAIQMGDTHAATVLQENATVLQTGNELSKSDQKKTRIASKTQLR
ncbi:MAG: Ca-activated chloride channel-like protein [Phormidesmis priestleyi Ana]|uniref:Ca-activated chloride channel-like protein n=1 Tax=Phormidesmis priestleyi Ana TaxID=1666911 RepID=A0A0P7ZR38_9CYAN|nr:MAG: Ca-activated chloride channel-like protein [Phormidesmis priestleyi Ana]